MRRIRRTWGTLEEKLVDEFAVQVESVLDLSDSSDWKDRRKAKHRMELILEMASNLGIAALVHQNIEEHANARRRRQMDKSRKKPTYRKIGFSRYGRWGKRDTRLWNGRT